MAEFYCFQDTQPSNNIQHIFTEHLTKCQALDPGQWTYVAPRYRGSSLAVGKLKEVATASRREQSGYSSWTFAGFRADFQLLLMEGGKRAQQNEL